MSNISVTAKKIIGLSLCQKGIIIHKIYIIFYNHGHPSVDLEKA